MENVCSDCRVRMRIEGRRWRSPRHTSATCCGGLRSFRAEPVSGPVQRAEKARVATVGVAWRGAAGADAAGDERAHAAFVADRAWRRPRASRGGRASTSKWAAEPSTSSTRHSTWAAASARRRVDERTAPRRAAVSAREQPIERRDAGRRTGVRPCPGNSGRGCPARGRRRWRCRACRRPRTRDRGRRARRRAGCRHAGRRRGVNDGSKIEPRFNSSSASAARRRVEFMAPVAACVAQSRKENVASTRGLRPIINECGG